MFLRPVKYCILDKDLKDMEGKIVGGEYLMHKVIAFPVYRLEE